MRMPRRSGSKMKRMRSPTRHRGSESGGEETATDEEMRERRTKQRHDTRYEARGAKERAAGRTPPKRRRRVVDISSDEEEEEQQLSPRGDDFDMPLR